MKKIRILSFGGKKIFFVLIFLFFIPLLVFGAEKKKAYYFSSETCPHCMNVEEYFQEGGIYEKYEIAKMDVSNPDNLRLLRGFFEVAGISRGGVPTVVFDGNIISGEGPIIKDFEKKIKRVAADKLPDPDSFKVEKRGETSLTIPVLIGAALVDAINPCAFAVLILLVATVIGSGGRKKALQAGLLFSLAVFISYVLMGVGLYKAITIFNLPKIISIVVGTLAIIIGLANLKDAFWHGKIFLMEVPMSWRPNMRAILEKVTSPAGAFGAGLLVSLFLLPCTSGPYVVILGLLAERVELVRTMLLLVMYNFIFVLPMIVITLAMYFGLKAGMVEQWRQKNISLLHGIAGVIMLIIGAYLLVSWL